MFIKLATSREIGFAKPQASLLDAEVPCNYIHCRLRGSTSESFRKPILLLPASFFISIYNAFSRTYLPLFFQYLLVMIYFIYNNNRMRIGLVLNILDEEYQISLYRGIKQRAEELGIQIVCFQEGNNVFVPDSFIGCFPRKEYFNLDGIILLTSVVFDNCMLTTKEDISRIWGNIPLVSVGQKIEGVPSLLIHTDDSIKEIMEHLVEKHQYKNFIYIGGTQTHHDSINREKLFTKHLKQAQSLDPKINYTIMHGNFTEQSAVLAMEEYFSKNQTVPDVVVCANDNMALGVYKYLNLSQKKSGVRKMAVTGFDDIPQGQFTIPPLTTIHQPLDKLGQEAVNMIYDLVQGKVVPLEKSVESHVVYRESCGCKKTDLDFETLRRSYEKMQSSYVVSEQMLSITSHIGQDLNNDNSEEDFVSIIDFNLSMLGVENFCILKFPTKLHSDEPLSDKLLCVRPVYVKIEGQRVTDFPVNKDGTMTLGEFYEFISGPSTPSKTSGSTETAYVLKYLNVGNDYIGCILYDAPVETLPYIILISVDIALTMNRIDANEKRKKYADNLENEVLKISEIERQRFSNDLHDDICQRLAGISMLCRSYSKMDSPVEKSQMEELAHLVSDTLQRTRQYAHNSYPVDLENIGLEASLSNLCASFEQQSGIKCKYEWQLPDKIDFDKTQKLNIFRIVQEALHNVMKHSKAKNVDCSCRLCSEQNGDYIVVRVIDDGIGISKEKMNNFGIGLNSMQYRANQIGAEFRCVALREPQGPQTYNQGPQTYNQGPQTYNQEPQTYNQGPLELEGRGTKIEIKMRIE